MLKECTLDYFLHEDNSFSACADTNLEPADVLMFQFVSCLLLHLLDVLTTFSYITFWTFS